MSDESKFFKKCKCINCSLPVSFPLEMVGKTIECPHCKCETVLTEEMERMPEKNVPPPDSERTPPAAPEKRDVVSTLEYVGEIFFSLGVFGMVAAAIIVAEIRYHDVESPVSLWMVGLAVVSLLQGLIVKTLFFGLAEVIRLLRSIDSKKAEAAPQGLELSLERVEANPKAAEAAADLAAAPVAVK